jgi:hypothetical protein
VGQLSVKGWTDAKLLAAYHAIHPEADVKLQWTPPADTRQETHADAVRRLTTVAQRLKG